MPGPCSPPPQPQPGMRAGGGVQTPESTRPKMLAGPCQLPSRPGSPRLPLVASPAQLSLLWATCPLSLGSPPGTPAPPGPGRAGLADGAGVRATERRPGEKSQATAARGPKTLAAVSGAELQVLSCHFLPGVPQAGPGDHAGVTDARATCGRDSPEPSGPGRCGKHPLCHQAEARPGAGVQTRPRGPG